MNLSVFLQLFRRRLPLVIVLSALGGAVGVWLALALPATYRSNAVMIVESGQIPDELAASTVETGEIEALQIIRQQIMSREVLLDMADDLGIFEDRLDMGADEKVEDLRSRIDIETDGGQVRRGAQDATILTVTFESREPALTAETVNQIVTLILQTNAEMRTSVARQTLDFFTDEVARFEEELEQINARILEFKEANLEALPDSLEFRREQLTRLEERLAELERERDTLLGRRAELVAMFETTGRMTIEGDRRASGRPQRSQARPAEQRLAELESEYASLEAVLSDTNPRMKVLRSRIEAAEEAVAALPPRDDGTEGDDADDGDARAMLDAQLTDMDAQIGYIEDQKADIEAEIARIQKTIEETPGNAVTLSTLERQQQNLKEQYNQAVANKARAETGSTIETLSRGQRITVVEQAVPPESPSSPNRPLVSVAGFSGGLFLSLAIVALMELLNQTVRRPQDIEDGLGIEVFGAVPYISTRRETVVLILRRLTILVVGVAAGGAALWYIDQNVTPLQPLVERITGLRF